jgi:TRAP-type C4-dicarboxylate transport system permease large subunit
MPSALYTMIAGAALAFNANSSNLEHAERQQNGYTDEDDNDHIENSAVPTLMVPLILS